MPPKPNNKKQQQQKQQLAPIAVEQSTSSSITPKELPSLAPLDVEPKTTSTSTSTSTTTSTPSSTQLKTKVIDTKKQQQHKKQLAPVVVQQSTPPSSIITNELPSLASLEIEPKTTSTATTSTSTTSTSTTTSTPSSTQLETKVIDTKKQKKQKKQKQQPSIVQVTPTTTISPIAVDVKQPGTNVSSPAVKATTTTTTSSIPLTKSTVNKQQQDQLQQSGISSTNVSSSSVKTTTTTTASSIPTTKSTVNQKQQKQQPKTPVEKVTTTTSTTLPPPQSGVSAQTTTTPIIGQQSKPIVQSGKGTINNKPVPIDVSSSSISSSKTTIPQVVNKPPISAWSTNILSTNNSNSTVIPTTTSSTTTNSTNNNNNSIKPTTTTTTTTTTSTSNNSRIRDINVQNLPLVPVGGKTSSFPTKPVKITTNLFPIQINSGTNTNWYQYRIDILNNDDQSEQFLSKGQMRQIITKFCSNNNIKLFLTDYRSIIFSTSDIQDCSFKIEPNEFSIRKTNTVSINSDCSIQLLNIFKNNKFKSLNYTSLNRNYYNMERAIFENAKLAIYSGFISSTITTECGKALLLDTSSKVVNKQTVHDKIQNKFKFNAGKSTEQIQKLCESEINGTIVYTAYSKFNHRISKIDWTKNPNSIMSPGTTYLKYYTDKYSSKGYVIKDLKQPLLEVNSKFQGKKQIIYLIPSLCQLTGIDKDTLSDFKTMQEIGLKLNLEPTTRMSQLSSFVTTNLSSANEYGLGVSSQPITVDGKIFESPKIKLSPTNDNSPWVIIYPKNPLSFLPPQQTYTDLDLSNLITKTGKPNQPIKIGFTMTIDKVTKKPSMPKNEIIEIIKQQQSNGIKFFLIIILSNDKSNTYDEIKSLNVVTQFIQCGKISKINKFRDFQSSISAKNSNQPWELQQGYFNDIPKGIMLIGIDVGHNTNIIEGRSVVGFVSTMNGSFGKVYSQICYQDKKNQEIVHEKLTEMTSKAINQYIRLNNNQPPTTIIVYRDGVGDGMLNLVKTYEIRSIKDSINQLSSIYQKPKLVYTIVKKNTNVRLMVNGGGGKFDNPEPGTIVDNGIISFKNSYEFFLTSIKPRSGTINPTHYHIIHDELGLSSSIFQHFTFMLCHLYFNVSGSYCMPHVCGFAHRLAFMVGRISRTPIPENLMFNAYYL